VAFILALSTLKAAREAVDPAAFNTPAVRTR
jgi:hypothetical protein